MKLHGNKSRITFVKLLMITCFLIIGTFVLDGTTLQVHAQGTATVAAASGKIRESADTSSGVMASVKQNDKLDITAQTTSGDGYTWYKVYVDGSKQGYIRADLVNNVEGSISKESADAAKSSDSDDESKQSDQNQITSVGSGNKKAESTADDNVQSEPSEPVSVSPSTVTAAKVVGSTVRVRETPSTNGKVKGSAKVDTEVTVSGETTDADGKTWYQVSYNSDDSTINGFIRSDFLEVTQTAEPTTAEAETETEAPTEEVPENNDYALKYEENDEGTMEWFLYDNLKGTKQSINNIYEIVKQSQDSEASDNDQMSKMKIILIVMAAVILLLVIGITILLFKVRDTYDAYDDEDEDDEEEEEEIVPVRRKKPSKKSSRKQSRRKHYEEDDDEDDEDDEDEEDEDDDEEDEEDEEEVIRPAKKNGKASQNGKASHNNKSSDANWQSKNFLDVDDDMEFEFLDIK